MHRDEWPSTCVSLLHRIRNPQDQQAWTTFVNVYTPLVYRQARRHGLQDADAHELVQQVFLNFSRRAPSFVYDRSKGQFRQFLLTVIRHAIYHLRQAPGMRPQSPGEGLANKLANQQPGATDAEWEDAFHARVLQCALERIRPLFTDEVWQVFEQVWREERPPAEVAAQCGRAVGWVYQAKFRVVRRLEEEIRFLSEDIRPS